MHTDSRSNHKMDPALERALMTELTRLRDELSTVARTDSMDRKGRPSLGLFRIFGGVSIETWREVARRLDLSGWLTLPIDHDAYPHLITLQENLERLAYESEHDGLTGLANRRAFERFVDLEIERAQRSKGIMSLAIIDLDDFKDINDTHGHPIGDQVLIRLSEIMQCEKRRYDMAARIGGEEFALVLPGVGQVRSRTILERVLQELGKEKFTSPNAPSFSVSFSAGIASFRGSMKMTVSTLMELADKALYKAKTSGKNRIKLAPLPDMETVPRETLVQANEKKFLFTGKQ